jgi:DNA-binding transcriptional LysR family regulator
LALAHQRAPGVRFQLLPQSDEPQRALERGEVDLLIIPQGYCSPDHPTEFLFDEILSCVVWSGGRFAAAPITLDDFKSAGHVVVTPRLDKPAFDGIFMQQYGIARKTEVTTFSFASAPFLVAGTDRIATVHTRLAEQACKLLPLTIKRLPMEVPKMRQVMQWHKYRAFDPGLVWLRGLLHEAVYVMDERPAAGAQAPAS